jgi:hypothetical protein
MVAMRRIGQTVELGAIGLSKHGPIPNRLLCALRIVAAFAAFTRIDSAH